MHLTVLLLAVVCTSLCTSLKIELYNKTEGTLRCKSSSTLDPIEWLVDDTVVKNNSKFIIKNMSTTATSYLTIINVNQTDSESDITCRKGKEETSYRFHVKPQLTSSTEQELNIVHTDGPLEIDCAMDIGVLTIEDSCVFISLRFNNFTANSTDNLSTFKDGNITNLSGYELSKNLTNPLFSVLEPVNRDHYQYRCVMFYDDDNNRCPGIQFITLDGPIHKIFYQPIVSLSSADDTNTVPEGSTLQINCTALDRNVKENPNYEIQWEVMNTLTRENYTNFTKQGNNGEILNLAASSDVDVTCTVVGKVEDLTLKNSSSVHISIAPRASVNILAEGCGVVTIVPNNTIGRFLTNITVKIDEDTMLLIKKDTINKTIDGIATEIKISTVVNGVDGNSETIMIPNCVEDDMTVVALNLTSTICDSETKDNEVHQVVSSLLQNVTDSCQLDVCPKFNAGKNWNIVSTAVNCIVTINISLPNSLLWNTIETFCNVCQIIEKPSPSTEPSTESPTKPDDLPMFVWIIILFCSGAGMILLFFSVFLTYKCIRLKTRSQNNRETDPEQRTVTPVRITIDQEPDELLNVPQNRRDICATSITPSFERHSQVSGYSNISSTNTIYSGHSRQSRRSTYSSRSPYEPHRYTDPNTGCPMVTINIPIDEDFIRIFSELGAHHSENVTQISADTGLGSNVDSNVENRNTLSVVDTQRRSDRSSGYEGSRAPAEINQDPNILNPYGKSGYTIDDDSNSSGSCSSKNSFKTPRNTQVYYVGNEQHHCSSV